MSTNRNTVGAYALEQLNKRYRVEEADLGTDARMDKGLMHIMVKKYWVDGIGSLCIVSMKGMLGLMKMETAVLACSGKDVPLLNLDHVDAMGRRTQIAELYDTMLSGKGPREETLQRLQAISDADRDLEEYTSAGSWSDALRYPCSYAKKTKKNTARTEASCRQFFDIFLEELEQAPACDANAKASRIDDFARRLLNEGGPAVDQVRRMFGDEITERLVLKHMYGTGDYND